MDRADGRRHRRGDWSSSLRRDDGSWQQGFAGDTLNVPVGDAGAVLPVQAATVSYVHARSAAMPCRRGFAPSSTNAGIDTTLVGTEPDRTIGLYTIETDAEGERGRFSYLARPVGGAAAGG